MRRAGLIRDSDATAVLPMALGTLVWFVVLVILLLQRSELDATGRGWWIQVGLAGLATGVIAVVVLSWRARRRSR